MGKQWKHWQTNFLSSKITEDSDCTHEIKRCMLLGRKAMTNIDSILKSRNITKVNTVKAMFFPVVTHGYKSWTIKKAESQRIDAFELWWWRTLKSPLDCKEIKPVNLKGHQPWIFTGRTGVEAEAPIFWWEGPTHWKRTWCLERLKTGGEGMTEDEMSWTASRTHWTWVWANCGRWWRTGKPGMLQSTGFQRVRHDWATEQQQIYKTLHDLGLPGSLISRRHLFLLQEHWNSQTLQFIRRAWLLLLFSH